MHYRFLLHSLTNHLPIRVSGKPQSSLWICLYYCLSPTVTNYNSTWEIVHGFLKPVPLFSLTLSEFKLYPLPSTSPHY